jgi:hypothetical protein
VAWALLDWFDLLKSRQFGERAAANFGSMFPTNVLGSGGPVTLARLIF